MTERRLNTVQAVRYSLEIVLSPGGSEAASGAAAGGAGSTADLNNTEQKYDAGVDGTTLDGGEI